MCKYEWARIFLVKGGKYTKFQHHGTYKFSWEKPKASTSNPSGHIKDSIM
jgi:hypothetical protein